MQLVIRTYFHPEGSEDIPLEIVDAVVDQRGHEFLEVTTSQSEQLLLPAYPGDAFLGVFPLVKAGYAIIAICNRCDTKKGREIVVDDSMVAKGNWLIGFKTKQNK